MRQITTWCKTKEELQFAVDQVEVYHPGQAVFKSRETSEGTEYCVCRQ